MNHETLARAAYERVCKRDEPTQDEEGWMPDQMSFEVGYRLALQKLDPLIIEVTKWIKNEQYIGRKLAMIQALESVGLVNDGD
jgi:hypothetical protein